MSQGTLMVLLAIWFLIGAVGFIFLAINLRTYRRLQRNVTKEPRDEALVLLVRNKIRPQLVAGVIMSLLMGMGLLVVASEFLGLLPRHFYIVAFYGLLIAANGGVSGWSISEWYGQRRLMALGRERG